jgi:DNA end-binding protein Ku
MRAIWTGSISFGLLQVPVQLFSATRDLDVHFRLLDGRDKKPIRYERINVDTGDEVPWKQIVKAYEVKKGDYVVVDEDEIKRAAPEKTQTIDLEAFVPRCDVDPLYFEKPYYVAPTQKAKKSYVLLRDVLAGGDRLGIARVVIRTRQYLAALHAEGNALMLTLMRFPQEVVEPAAVGLTASELGKPKISQAELDMAHKLVEAMAKPWKPAEYKDEFRTKLRHMLERRAKKGALVAEPPQEEVRAQHAEITDLVSLLQKSLRKPGGKRVRRATRRSGRPRRKTARRAR